MNGSIDICITMSSFKMCWHFSSPWLTPSTPLHLGWIHTVFSEAPQPAKGWAPGGVITKRAALSCKSTGKTLTGLCITLSEARLCRFMAELIKAVSYKSGSIGMSGRFSSGPLWRESHFDSPFPGLLTLPISLVPPALPAHDHFTLNQYSVILHQSRP